MSDVSKTNELIAEARQCHQARGWSKDPLVDKLENLANRLADALEAATRERDAALAAHDAEVAAKALINMALTLEIPRFISSYNQEPPMQRMTNAEIVDALRARAAEYREAVGS